MHKLRENIHLAQLRVIFCILVVALHRVMAASDDPGRGTLGTVSEPPGTLPPLNLQVPLSRPVSHEAPGLRHEGGVDVAAVYRHSLVTFLHCFTHPCSLLRCAFLRSPVTQLLFSFTRLIVFSF